jgi:modification methylase
MMGSFEMRHKDSSDMSELANGSVDLVITSPPYFSAETEILLKVPLADQTHVRQVQAQVTAFAHSLSPVFHEIGQILKPGGVLVLQTKDLRYGPFLVSLADCHHRQVLDAGLLMVTKVLWQSQFLSHAQRARRPDTATVGRYVAPDVEAFHVYTTEQGFALRGAPVQLDDPEREECHSPLWCLPGNGGNQTHPYQSPASVLKRFVSLYSAPGDLVVDPFAGHGTALRLAARLGRKTVGYEIDAKHVEKAIALYDRRRR